MAFLEKSRARSPLASGAPSFSYRNDKHGPNLAIEISGEDHRYTLELTFKEALNFACFAANWNVRTRALMEQPWSLLNSPQEKAQILRLMADMIEKREL